MRGLLLMNKECTEYLRRIKCTFPIFHEKEKRFYIDFSLSLKEYADRHPNCTKKDLIESFGTPKDIVITYYDNMSFNLYDTILKQKQHVKQFFIGYIIVNTCLFIVGSCCFMLKKMYSKDKYLPFKYRK